MATTRLGRWAIGLFVASVVLLATLIVAYNTDALGVFEQRTAGGLALWIAAAVAAVATLITGAELVEVQGPLGGGDGGHGLRGTGHSALGHGRYSRELTPLSGLRSVASTPRPSSTHLGTGFRGRGGWRRRSRW